MRRLSAVPVEEGVRPLTLMTHTPPTHTCEPRTPLPSHTFASHACTHTCTCHVHMHAHEPNLHMRAPTPPTHMRAAHPAPLAHIRLARTRPPLAVYLRRSLSSLPHTRSRTGAAWAVHACLRPKKGWYQILTLFKGLTSYLISRSPHLSQKGVARSVFAESQNSDVVLMTSCKPTFLLFLKFRPSYLFILFASTLHRLRAICNRLSCLPTVASAPPYS